MNTRILLSVLIIVAVVAGVSAVTFAFFSDSGTSTDNVFESGTIILKLSDNDQFDQDTVAATFGGTNMVPGDTATGTLNLKNTGTHVANHAEVAVVDTDTTTPALDKELELTTLTYGGVDILSQVTDLNSNTWKDLDDLEAGSGLDNLALTDLNTDHALVMTVTFRSDAGNDYQGGSVTSLWTITLNQVASQ